MSALPPKADMCSAIAHVCFGPKADIFHSNDFKVFRCARLKRGRPRWRAAPRLRRKRYLVQGLDRQRYALTAADAKRDKTAGQAVAPHRVDQLSRQHRTGRADRMAMGHGATFNVDDLFWQPKLASDNDGDRCEGFIDLGALNGANIPAGALQGLLDRGHGSQSEHARLDRSDAVRDQACGWSETTFVGPRVVGEHHGRSGVVQSRGIAGGDCAVWTEGRFEPRQRFDRRVGSVVFILVELGWSFFSGDFHRYDLRFEMTISLRRGEQPLRSQCPAVLRLAGDLVFLDQIFGMPARVRVRESVVQSVAQHTVIERPIAHAVAPTASRYEIRRLVHVLHAPRHRDIDIAEGDFLRRGNDGLRSRAADSIDGECWGGDREPGVDGSLAGGIHLGASLDDVAHDDRFHLIGANVRARDRSGDCYRPKSGSRNVLERASKGADRRPNRLRENNRTLRCHGKPPDKRQIDPNRGATSCRRRSGRRSRVNCYKRRVPSGPRQPQVRSPRRLRWRHSRSSELDRRRDESKSTLQTKPTGPKVRTALRQGSRQE